VTKQKTHKGIAKRFKKSHPKKGMGKLTRQSKGRGSKHLKTKQSNPRKRRIRRTVEAEITKSLKRVARRIK
jgi:ribosomal protein L35